jgi:hypothetical protein
MARAFGLCCNTITSIEVVTADGEQLTCDHDRHPRAVLGTARRHRQRRTTPTTSSTPTTRSRRQGGRREVLVTDQE